MAKATIKYGKYGKYSGPYIIGTRNTPTVAAPDLETPFMTRAFWLTIMAESLGRFGVVNMRDGTGVTAGLHQAVGCLPKSLKAQGPLFELLWRLNTVIDLSVTRVGSLFEGECWALAPGGTLVDEAGRPVTGRRFRDVVTPPGGQTPKEGSEWRTARAWAAAFHELFADSTTHRTQILFGVEALHRNVCRFRANKYLQGHTVEEVGFKGNAKYPYPFDSEEADLAHALLLSFAINAPTWAFQVYNVEIKRVAKNLNMDAVIEGKFKDLHNLIDTENFGRRLIGSLTKKSVKWDDDVRGSRYQRSRAAAMQVWSSHLFDEGGVMAEDLPG